MTPLRGDGRLGYAALVNREDLARITEIKQTLSGASKTFNCRVLARRAGELTVLFVSTKVYSTAGLTLPVGTVTFGHFWTDRPYNVYHWMEPSGRTIAFYFNLASDTRFDESVLHWRDLVLDVLIVPGGEPQVLDEHELPPDLDADTRALIAQARGELLSRAAALVVELGRQADALWPQVFAGQRAS
jgi:hypothetical protein